MFQWLCPFFIIFILTIRLHSALSSLSLDHLRRYTDTLFLMLFFLFLAFMLRTPSTSTPLPDAFATNSSSLDVDPLSICQCPPISQRSVWDIFWSCISTTFLVTWFSVHPNIPSPGEPWRWIYWRRVKAVIWALLAQELMIAWAWRQRLGAKKVMKL